MSGKIDLEPTYTEFIKEINKLRKQLELVQKISVGLASFNITEGDVLLAMEKENDALRAKLAQAEQFHPRAMKLIAKKKNFLVVACDEPYYRQVYVLIRDEEMLQGRWTIEDENNYTDALRKLGD